MKILFIPIAVLLAACAKAPEQTAQVGAQSGISVDTLFTKDACTVYRFYDAGAYRYFTNCSGATNWRRSTGSGKTHHYRDEGVEGGQP